MRPAHLVCYQLSLHIVLMCSELLHVGLSKNQPKTWSQHLRSPKHICRALNCAPSDLWLDLRSPIFLFISWQEGNSGLGMACCCFRPEIHSWSSLRDLGKWCPTGSGQERREKDPPSPAAEGHLSDSCLVTWSLPSPAEELSATQCNSLLGTISHVCSAHTEFAIWYRHTPLCHTLWRQSEVIGRLCTGTVKAGDK